MPVCEVGALTGDGGVQLLGVRIVHDADGRFRLHGETERYTDIWILVDEVGGAVDRVDYECWGLRNEGWVRGACRGGGIRV